MTALALSGLVVGVPLLAAGLRGAWQVGRTYGRSGSVSFTVPAVVVRRTDDARGRARELAVRYRLPGGVAAADSGAGPGADGDADAEVEAVLLDPGRLPRASVADRVEVVVRPRLPYVAAPATAHRWVWPLLFSAGATLTTVGAWSLGR